MMSNLPGNHATPSVLIVDDTPANLNLLAGILRDQGYEPRPCLDASRALAAAQADPPALVLLDIRMPGMDGFEACERLKSLPGLADVPVIFITATGEIADKVKAFSLGAVDFVTKPFEVEDVRVRVRTHLELSRQRRELRKSYEDLRILERQRDSLVHMIVHDMRSPLMAIMGNLEVARLESPPGDMAAALEDAWTASTMLLGIVSTLLDVSKMESGQLSLQISQVDVRALIGETIQLFQPLRGEREISMEVHAGVAAIGADRQLLQRVLHNLVGNALKFTDPCRGVIRVSAEPGPGNRIRVAVADNGHGIPAEHRVRVFEKFYQVDARRTDRAVSTGLGLTFCRLAVEAHGGGIGLDSSVGQGSTFWFELPVVP